ncbi:MAG: hypothetical protein LBE08_02045 [Bifidobacteriaceae bacterium]|jgi:hypothetical protein|nr:hypothetical protein [Bifidobacteriaceae bacterium]
MSAQASRIALGTPIALGAPDCRPEVRVGGGDGAVRAGGIGRGVGRWVRGAGLGRAAGWRGELALGAR